MLKFVNGDKKNFLKKLEIILQSRKLVQKNKLNIVQTIIKNVKKNGDKALIRYEKKFSKIRNKKTNIKFSQKEQEKYINTIFKLLKPSGHYILHGDEVETDPEYMVNIEEFIRPKFNPVEIMGFNSLETITCPNHGTIWNITFWKK